MLAGATFAGDSVRGSDAIELRGCSGPDLIVSAITIPTTTIVYGAAPPTWIAVTVQNVGDTPISGTLLRGTIVDMTQDGVLYDIGGYFRITYSEPLGPGEVVTHRFAVGHHAVWPPAHYDLQVQVDDINEVAESDETNNVSSRISFDVVAPAVSARSCRIGSFRGARFAPQAAGYSRPTTAVVI